jgi:DNA polymerase-1
MIILIDANALCHQAKHSVDLDYEGLQTGIIFLFLRKIISLAKTLQSNHFVFAWDSRNSKRKEYFPAYKANRHKERTPEEESLDISCSKQFNSLKTIILPKIGFNSCFFDGFEADDLIASIVQNNEGPFTIISSDADLYQLLRPDVFMFWKDKYFTSKDFFAKYQIYPDSWEEAKSISGCNTDAVPGIEGVGEITACKYLRGELSPKSKTYQKIVSTKGIELIHFNSYLVTLPLEGTPIIKLQKQPVLSFDAYTQICGKYGFQSMLEKEYLQSCQKILNLQ